MSDEVKFEVVKVEVPEGTNIIIGQSHFIKTVEDLYEVLVSSVPGVKFGLGFVEASGERLVRHEGTDEELRRKAAEVAYKIGAGHIFVIYLREAWPINVLNEIKNCPEVARVLCATANPVEVVVVETEQGRGITAVIDGFKPLGVEKEGDIRKRMEFLRKIGYKR